MVDYREKSVTAAAKRERENIIDFEKLYRSSVQKRIDKENK